MNGQELPVLIPNMGQGEVLVSPGALSLKDDALMAASFIETVSDAPSQDEAVAALRTLKNLLKQTEDARKAVKQPGLEYCKRVDSVAKEFSRELCAEEARIEGLVNEFQTLELARIRAAENARKLEDEKREKERQESIAKATSLDEVDQLNEVFNQENQKLSVEKAASTKAEGQSVVEDWDVEVMDIWLLASRHQNCVKLEPKLSEIKALLKMGIKVAGVTATKKVRTVIR